MASSFGWLDTDSEQRRKMLEVVDLFKEQGTVDELGIGSIRDALSDAMFPGTSYLHTRLRYVLFVPWLLEQAGHSGSPTQMSDEFRKLEYRLITSLLAGDERQGVIGNTARDRLKRMPSAMYWSALSAWGIRTADFSADGFFRHQYDHRALARRTVRADDPEARDQPPSTGLDPHIPRPPADLMKAASFALRPEDEQYLTDQIIASTGGSMLAWLVRNEPGVLTDYVWDLDNLADAPAQLRGLADHARRFHTVIHGAALTYNLLLARKSEQSDLASAYEVATGEWRNELVQTGALEGWSTSDWWATIRRQNPRIATLTVQFVDHWRDLVEVDSDVANSSRAADLLAARERQIKGGRARLLNQAALDRWSGASGLGRHEFRWSVARRHLDDLYEARRAS